MSGPACAYPRAALKLYELVQRGQLDRAIMLQRATWPLNEAFRSYPLGACIKAALACRGYEVGGPIEPQEPLAANAVEQIRRALATADTALSDLGEG
jgi:4-hydroxy-tetrahydrodipicolinate synthase